MQLKYDKLTSRSASNSFWLICYYLNKNTHTTYNKQLIIKQINNTRNMFIVNNYSVVYFHFILLFYFKLDIYERTLYKLYIMSSTRRSL